MKKMIFVLMLIFSAANTYAADDNLYERYEDYNEIKVYIHEVRNEASNPVVDEKLFASGFKEALHGRRTLRFKVVDNEAGADVIIKPAIREYVFTEEAMPLAISPLLVAADLMKPKSSARLVVDYEMIDAKTGKILTIFKNFTTYSRRLRGKITEDEYYKETIRENAHRFILRAFYKPKEGR